MTPTCTEEDTHEHVDYADHNKTMFKSTTTTMPKKNTQELGVEADWLILTCTNSKGIISRATLHCRRKDM